MKWLDRLSYYRFDGTKEAALADSPPPDWPRMALFVSGKELTQFGRVPLPRDGTVKFPPATQDCCATHAAIFLGETMDRLFPLTRPMWIIVNAEVTLHVPSAEQLVPPQARCPTCGHLK